MSPSQAPNPPVGMIKIMLPQTWENSYKDRKSGRKF